MYISAQASRLNCSTTDSSLYPFSTFIINLTLALLMIHLKTWMGQGKKASPESAVDDEPEVDVRLFNDIYFSRAASLPTGAVSGVWAPFPRLPAELRRLIWLLFLRRHRMIDVTLGLQPGTAEREAGTPYPGDLPEGAGRRYYTARNHLGNVVSSRGYTVAIEGDRFAAWLSPLLWVNSEAREIALGFYRVHLPAPRRHPGRLLYLNPEYDVLYVRPCGKSGFLPAPDMPEHRREARLPGVLVDFLCDIRAYDPKDQGCAWFLLSSPPIQTFIAARAYPAVTGSPTLR
jgi:hypothetical protein